MGGYDEGYRAGMQIVRDLGHKWIKELEDKLAEGVAVGVRQNEGWKCPINSPNCEENCGNYGCGN